MQDEHELPAPIGFDLGVETLPTSKVRTVLKCNILRIIVLIMC